MWGYFGYISGVFLLTKNMSVVALKKKNYNFLKTSSKDYDEKFNFSNV